MVLEKILEARHAKNKPMATFFLGAIISIIALFISYTVFRESTGLFTIVIISLAMVPLMNTMLKEEESETVKYGEGQTFFQRYGDIIKAYTSLFCGMILAMSLAFVALPESTVERIFDEQIREVNLIRGQFTFEMQFWKILSNNASVLMISFLFSFLLGSGAIFILSWNASVLSAAIGLVARTDGGVGSIPRAVLMFLPHGSFEIMAYFIGAIAGGLVSAALMRRKSLKFWFVIKDSVKLLAFSFALLVIGGMIETFIILS